MFAIALDLCGCGTLVPDFPEVWQCGYSIKFNKFRCVNKKTGQAMNLRRDDPAMEAAQCLSADDYKKASAWVDTVKQIAERRCK